MMQTRTLGIIYAAKRSREPREGIRAFMSKYSGTPASEYSNKEINQLVEKALCDCLDSVEHPSAVMSEYFHFRSAPYYYSPFDAAVATFYGLQVKRLNYETNEYEYINGFSELDKEYYDYTE